MKTYFLIILTLITLAGCSGNDKNNKVSSEETYRVEILLEGTEKTAGMAIGLHTSKGCYITNSLTKVSSKDNDDPESLMEKTNETKAVYTTNGKYIIITAACGSCTYPGACMKINVYKKDKLIKSLMTHRLKPINKLEFNTASENL